MLTSIDDIKRVVSGVLKGITKHRPLNDECSFNVSLVINELLVNCFEHAKPSKQSPVIFKAGIKNGTLVITVTDRGAGFEYEKTCASVTADSLLRERGRGLTLVRALCQEICYNSVGNSVEVKIAI